MDLEKFSDQQLAGQRLMVGFDGTALDSTLKRMIDTLKVGGIILFKRNVATPSQLQRLCSAAQAHARQCGQPPLIIAVDQEGGPVARLTPPHFSSAPGCPDIQIRADACRHATAAAAQLAAMGVNMNMAPVMDVAFRFVDSIMARRAFSHDPQRVSILGAAVIDSLQQRGVMSVAKHFPGIGRTTTDSHQVKPVLGERLDIMAASDLLPFSAAISRGVAGIMLAHIVYTDIDPHWPGSLSPAIARTLLRHRMGYRGLVITDDLDMGAIDGHFDVATVIGQVLAADIDMALICHPGLKIETAFEELLKGLHDKALRLRCQASVGRIMMLKTQYIG